MILSPNKQQQLDLRALCDVPPASLDKLVQMWCDDQKTIIRTPSELNQDAIEVLQDPNAARAIVTQSLSLHGFMRRSGRTSSDAMDGLTEGLAAVDGFPLDNWRKLEPIFQKLLESTTISNAAAAIELRFDYANICDDIRMITDIRPIFSRGGDHINGGIVSFTMRIEYTSNEVKQQISLALDQQDVQKLVETCRRSLTKAETAKALFDDIKVPGVVSGAGGGDSI